MYDFESWKNRWGYSNNDVLTSDYLERIKLEPELVRCACGCGQLRPRFDKQGIERRYIKGHGSIGRKLSPELIVKMQEGKRKKREHNQADIIMKIYNSLPTNKFESVSKIASDAGISSEACLRNLEIIDLVFSLQSKNWLEIVKAGKRKYKFYRRKPKRSEKVDG